MSPTLREKSLLKLDIGPVGKGCELPAQASLAPVPVWFGQSSSCSVYLEVHC